MDYENGVGGDAQGSQPRTNAEHIPTVSIPDEAPKLNTQDTELSMRNKTPNQCYRYCTGTFSREFGGSRDVCACGEKNEDRGG